MTPRQEAELRSAVLPSLGDRWVALAFETDTPDESYRAAACGLSLEEWAPCARAGADFEAVLQAVRSIYLDEAGAQTAARELARLSNDVARSAR